MSIFGNVFFNSGNINFDYENLEELTKEINTLNDDECEKIKSLIFFQKPDKSMSHSLLHAPIMDQMPKIVVTDIAIGISSAFLLYSQTKNVLASVATGFISACIGWKFLVALAYINKEEHEKEVNKRADDLLRDIRVIKSKDSPESKATSESSRARVSKSMSQHGNIKFFEEQMKAIQIELEQTKPNENSEPNKGMCLI